MSSVGSGLPSSGLTELTSLRLSQGSQLFCTDFPHTDGPLVGSENTEGSLAWCYSSRMSGQRLGGHRCPGNCIESISCHLSPVSFIIQLGVYFGDSICRVYDTLVNWYVLSQFICWRTGVHIIRTNSPTDSNWCLGWQSEPTGQGLKVHEE